MSTSSKITKDMKTALDVSVKDIVKLAKDANKPTDDEKKILCEVLKAFISPTMDEKAIKELAAAATYLGWDPIETLKEFVVLNAGRTGEEISRMITTCLVFFCVRGSNFKADNLIERSTDPEAMKKIVKCCDDLGLKVKSENKTVMTLPRLAALYPSHMATVAHYIKDGKAEHGLAAKYCFPHSPVLMDDNQWTINENSYYTWCFHLNKRINSGKNGNKARREMTFEEYKKLQESIVVTMRSGVMFNVMNGLWKDVADKLV